MEKFINGGSERGSKITLLDNVCLKMPLETRYNRK